jgi:hypothetical protein
MTDFTATIDTTEVDAFNRAMPREIFNATRSAVRTTTTFAEKELEKRMANASKIPLKAFKVHRVLSKSSDESGKIWFGLKPIKARFAGALSEEVDGASAGSYFFRKAFVAKIGNAPENIFKRKGKSRFPVVTQIVELQQATEITADVSVLAEQELLTRFSKKLNAYIEKRESAA